MLPAGERRWALSQSCLGKGGEAWVGGSRRQTGRGDGVWNKIIATGPFQTKLLCGSVSPK